MDVLTRPMTLGSDPSITFPADYAHESEIFKSTSSRSFISSLIPRHALYTAIQNPSPSPTHLPEIQTPLTPLDATMTSLASTVNPRARNRATLLTIPLEIRLQIYNYVLQDHPIHHAHLSPLTPSSFAPTKQEEFHHTLFRPQRAGQNSSPNISHHNSPPTATPLTSSTIPAPPTQKSIPPHSPISSMLTHPTSHQSSLFPSPSHPPTQSRLPTALLLSCAQIFSESHLLPFQTSYFTFVNWFWSGVYAARQFSRSLRPWQVSTIRWTSLEVLGRDLVTGEMEGMGGGIGVPGKGRGEWSELCGLWRGVRGLRLGVKGSFTDGKGRGEVDGSSGWNGEDGPVVKSTSLALSEHEDRGLLNTDLDWVQHGLLSMKSLRWIELEIEDAAVSRDIKLRFCQDLSNVLDGKRDRSDGWEGEVKVVFVERVVVEAEKEKREFVTYVGNDDPSVW